MGDSYELLIPKYLTKESVHQLSNSFCKRPQECKNVHFKLDHLSFIDPVGVTTLSNYIQFLENSGIVVTVQLPFGGTHNSSILFLDDAQFFKEHAGQTLRLNVIPRKTTMPLRKIKTGGIRGWINLSFTPWLKGHLTTCGLPENSDFIHSLETIIVEIFNNINDHSSYDIGTVFAQWFPNKGSLEISISDFGVGIPSTVKSIIKNTTHSGYIMEAVKSGVTAKSKKTNQGLGLATLIDIVVKKSLGSVKIYSLEGVVDFIYDPISGYRCTPHDRGNCPGTTILIKINTGRVAQAFPDNDEEGEIQW